MSSARRPPLDVSGRAQKVTPHTYVQYGFNAYCIRARRSSRVPDARYISLITKPQHITSMWCVCLEYKVCYFLYLMAHLYDLSLRRLSVLKCTQMRDPSEFVVCLDGGAEFIEANFVFNRFDPIKCKRR